MNENYFHPQTMTRLDSLAGDLPQSLLFAGPVGVGLSAAANYLANQIGTSVLTVLPEKNDTVDIDKGVISVDSIRRLYDQTKTIESGKRLIVVDYAERMGRQAQNAFLKLLEEPGKNTHFLLLTHTPAALLPTVRSRVTKLDIKPITAKQSQELLDRLGVTDPTKLSQLLFIASGLPAELQRLVSDTNYFDHRSQIIKDARSYLQGSAYQRLQLANEYKDRRQDSLVLLGDAMHLIQLNVESGKTELLPHLQPLLVAYERIQQNGNARLQLATAMV